MAEMRNFDTSTLIFCEDDFKKLFVKLGRMNTMHI